MEVRVHMENNKIVVPDFLNIYVHVVVLGKFVVQEVRQNVVPVLNLISPFIYKDLR